LTATVWEETKYK